MKSLRKSETAGDCCWELCVPDIANKSATTFLYTGILIDPKPRAVIESMATVFGRFVFETC